MAKLNVSEFIKLSKSKFDNIKNIDEIKFTHYMKPIKFICKIHGEFMWSPRVHIKSKYGCKKCGIDHRIKEKSIGIDMFISRAKSIWGEKYDYSQVEYKNCGKKVKIKCLKHDHLFIQSPDRHWNGHEGCELCQKEHMSINNISKREDVKQKKRDVWLSKYGVENISQNEKIHTKQHRHTYKKFTFPSGKTFNVQGYENYAINLLLETYIEQDIILKDKQTIKYFWSSEDGYGDDKWHIYFPDIIIPSKKLIIEVKSKWTYDGNGIYPDRQSKNLAKQKYSKLAGWDHKIWIMKKDILEVII